MKWEQHHYRHTEYRQHSTNELIATPLPAYRVQTALHWEIESNTTTGIQSTDSTLLMKWEQHHYRNTECRQHSTDEVKATPLQVHRVQTALDSRSDSNTTTSIQSTDSTPLMKWEQHHYRHTEYREHSTDEVTATPLPAYRVQTALHWRTDEVRATPLPAYRVQTVWRTRSVATRWWTRKQWFMIRSCIVTDHKTD